MIDQRGLAWMVYIFLDKKSASNGDAKNEIVSNREILLHETTVIF